MDMFDRSVSVDDIGRRHGFDVKSPGALAFGIRGKNKTGGVAGEKGFGIVRVFIEVDAHDLQALILELLMHFIQERKGFRAGPAPGSPKVQIDDFALEFAKVDLSASIDRGQCTGRRGFAFANRQRGLRR